MRRTRRRAKESADEDASRRSEHSNEQDQRVQETLTRDQDESRKTRALVKIASSIWPVTRPVNVFCWLGW
jgi:hypothetical protein